MPADELPTRHAAAFSSAMNSSAGTLVMNRILRGRPPASCSRKWRSRSAISPVPASGFGQNQIVGMPSADDRAQRRLEVLPVVGLGRDRMLNHHQERLGHVDRRGRRRSC